MYETRSHLFVTVCKSNNNCSRFFVFVVNLHILHFAVTQLARNFRTEKRHRCFVVPKHSLDILRTARFKHFRLVRIIDHVIYKLEVRLPI